MCARERDGVVRGARSRVPARRQASPYPRNRQRALQQHATTPLCAEARVPDGLPLPARCGRRSLQLRSIQVGDAFTAIKLDDGFLGLDCPQVDMAERLAGKKTLVVGLPGAFTPT